MSLVHHPDCEVEIGGEDDPQEWRDEKVGNAFVELRGADQERERDEDEEHDIDERDEYRVESEEEHRPRCVEKQHHEVEAHPTFFHSGAFLDVPDDGE